MPRYEKFGIDLAGHLKHDVLLFYLKGESDEFWSIRWRIKAINKKEAIKSGCDRDSGFVRYNGLLYYVDFGRDIVVQQLEYK